VHLNNTMRLITETLRPTQLQCLPVLAYIAPANLRRKAATDSLIEKTKRHQDWQVQLCYLHFSMTVCLSVCLSACLPACLQDN